jgi:hypothetical protein
MNDSGMMDRVNREEGKKNDRITRKEIEIEKKEREKEMILLPWFIESRHVTVS